MSRHRRVVIELSLTILRAASARATTTRVDSIEVRLALRCLLHHCAERWPLEMFWESAAAENAIGRAQGTTAAYNGIVRQLRASGLSDDVDNIRGET
ncbi:MAG: hypothetical protein IT473_06495 [Lysobacter sp.]|nr:hypothetical protein [Lysobacter sp.]